MNTDDLITAAQAAHTDELATEAIDKAEEESLLEEDRQGTIEMARAWALEVLGAPAETLQWRHHPEGETRGGLSAAIAALTLPPGHVHTAHLIYLLDSLNSSSQTLFLTRTCHACADELLNEVGSLAELGRLVDDGRPHAQDVDTADGQELGPLAAIELVEDQAARVARLVRRLTAEHPDAAFVVRHVSLFGAESGTGGAEIQLKADGIDTVRQMAAALGGAEVITSHGDASYGGMVLEHADASTVHDGIKVSVTGYRRLPDDEAAAWLAQQDQPSAETADGGDV